MPRLNDIRARQNEIRTRQQAIRDELVRIENLPEPPDADPADEAAVATRAQTLADRSTSVDTLVSEFDDLEAEFGTLDTEAQPLQARADALSRVRSASLDLFNLEPGAANGAPAVHVRNDPFDGFDVHRSDRQDTRTRAMRLIEREKEIVSADNQGHLERQVRRSLSDENPNYDGDYIARRMLITEHPAYRSAFMKKMVFGANAALSNEESNAIAAFQEFDMRTATRAASEGTPSAGGYGVPVLIDPTIILTSGAADAPLLRASRIETVTNNVWKGVSSSGMVWSYDAEGSAVSDDTPTLAQPQVPVYMARGWIPYSIEVGMDYPGFASEMAKLIDQGYIDLTAKQSVTGSGSNVPRGIFTAISANTTGSIIDVTTTGSFGAPDVFKVWNNLPERFRARATWLMSVTIESQIRQFATNANNAAYFTVDLTADGISRINGRPVITTDYAPSTLPTTSGVQPLLVVGDFGTSFLIAQRAGMQIEQVQTVFDTTSGTPVGRRGWFAWARNGMDSINDNGFRLLRNSN